MADFLLENYFLVVYGITWFLSIYFFKKYFDTPLRFFPILISYTFLTELLGTMVTFSIKDFQLIYDAKEAFHTSIIYNIYHFIYFLYFFLVYQKSFQSKSQKKLVNVFIGIFILSNLINLFVQNPKVYSLVYAYLTGSILLIILIFKYLWNLKILNINYHFRYNLLAWVSYGLLSFYTLYIPIKCLKEFSFESYEPYRSLHIFIVIVMYVLFSIGFIISKRRAFK